MSKHTKGPWLLAGGNHIQPTPAGPVIARIDPRRKSDEVSANGQLIAAAPELLKSLQDMVEEWPSVDDNESDRKYAEARDLLERLGVEIVAC